MTEQYYKKTLKFKALDRVRQLSGNVVLRENIEDMGSPRQISRCFKDLVEMGELVKIGYGIYAKAYISECIKKPVIKGGFGQVCKEALTKLGVEWHPGSAEQDYNADGTCLTKAHKIVKRMSEDVDFKIQVKEINSNFTRTRFLKELKEFRSYIN